MPAFGFKWDRDGLEALDAAVVRAIWATMQGFERVLYPARPRWQKPGPDGPEGIYFFPAWEKMIADILEWQEGGLK